MELLAEAPVTATVKSSPAVILLVEDDPGDQVLTQEAFKTLRVPHDLRVVCDGKEAMDYLYRQGDYESVRPAPRPDLILLDLHMPRMNGQQVAERIQSDPEMARIPIVVLTTSHRSEDMVRAYGRGVASYIGKPLDFNRFVAAVQDLEMLIRYAVAIKNIEAGTQLTDRQLHRLARRQRQLARFADALFDRQMSQIQAILHPGQVEADCETGPDPATAEEAGARQSLARLARRILRGQARGLDAPEPPLEEPAPYVSPGPLAEADDCAEGLYKLAERLRNSAQKAARRGEPPRLGKPWTS